MVGRLVTQGALYISSDSTIIDRSRQRNYCSTRNAFRQDREVDTYRCPADKMLGYCNTRVG